MNTELVNYIYIYIYPTLIKCTLKESESMAFCTQLGYDGKQLTTMRNVSTGELFFMWLQV